MSNRANIVDLERQGWESLSSGSGKAKEFYGSVLADDAHMLFPGEIRLVGKAQILETMGGPPWQSFEMSETQIVKLSDTVQAITYKVLAQREGDKPYRALICSTYSLRPPGWQLVVHQHTPV
ncbi:MAG: DUF4440 domain-containing protein [Halomonas sp.]|nr:DUF4440 domain-containing protein [Halomonas sp.]MCC5884770.1 DUF4440 domain-containing protein [Halomonas sp.]